MQQISKNSKSNPNPNSGFTIVELLVVIVVIGILAAITIVSYTGISNRAIAVSLQSDLSSAATQLKVFQATDANGNYPTANNCPTPGATEICLKASNGNTFAYISNGTTYTLTETNANGTVYNVTDNTVVAAGPLTTVPLAPTSLSVTAGVTQVTLNWSAPSSNGNSTITNYKVYRSTTSGSETILTTLGNVLTYTNTGLTGGTTYYYKLTAINSVGEGALTSEANGTAIVAYTLTITAGANGTVSTAINGSYASGSTPTITATPSGIYVFSSWSGSTGCSGVASHTITMDANKTCTANFTLGADWLAIGTQVWAKANLNVGTIIAGASAQTNNSSLEKYCYNNTESNCTTYGGLYQWDEAMQYVTTNGAQGICPTGSHIPTDAEWKILEVQLGMSQAQADATGYRGTDQGTQLKIGGSSGLNMPLAGTRPADGSFGNLSSYVVLWSSSESSTSAWQRSVGSFNATVYRGADAKSTGFSVRCLGN